MKVKVQNEYNDVKEIKLGFSWTFFFWSVLVPLFRGDWKWFFILLAVDAVLGATGIGIGLIPLLNLGLSFFYNKFYAKDLRDKGYKGFSEQEHELFMRYVND